PRTPSPQTSPLSLPDALPIYLIRAVAQGLDYPGHGLGSLCYVARLAAVLLAVGIHHRDDLEQLLHRLLQNLIAVRRAVGPVHLFINVGNALLHQGYRLSGSVTDCGDAAVDFFRSLGGT